MVTNVIGAVQEFASQMAELGVAVEGTEIALPEHAWRSVEKDMVTRELFAPLPTFNGNLDRPSRLPMNGPMCIHLHTMGGLVILKRAS